MLDDEDQSVSEVEKRNSSTLNELLLFKHLGLRSLFNFDNDRELIEKFNTIDEKQTVAKIQETIKVKEDDWLERPENHPIIYMKELDSSLCVGFSTKKGQQIFKNAIDNIYMNTYFTLAPHFHTQCETNLCGAGTLTMTLNALKVDPNRMWKYPWRWYDEYMINSCIPVEVVMGKGIDFDEFACTMRCNKLEVEAVRVSSQSSFKEFRRDVKRATSSFHIVLLVNYGRSKFNQTGTGHYSPIGGYDKSTDMALIMDTARFKLPPHWVKLSQLWIAMQEVAVGMSGNTEDMPRGYFLVKKNEKNPTTTVKLLRNYRLTIDPANRSENVEILENLFYQWNKFLDLKETKSDVLQIIMEKIFIVCSIPNTKKKSKEVRILNKKMSALFPVKKLQSTEIFRKIYEFLSTVCPTIIDSLLAYVIDTWNAFDTRSMETRRKCFVAKNVREFPDEISTISFAITTFLLFWPYRACEAETTRMKLQNYVAVDLSLFDQGFYTTINEQIYFLLKTFEHLGHEKIYKAEEEYFD